MICPHCGEDRSTKDFLGKEFCYRCVYQNKLNLNQKKCNLCKECKEPILKKRYIFCSNECMQKHHSKKNKLYWFRVINIQKVSWKSTSTIKFRTEK